MSDQEEKRGWEVQSSYKPHWLDDSEVDIGIEDAEGPNGFVYVMLIFAMLAFAYLVMVWLELSQ